MPRYGSTSCETKREDLALDVGVRQSFERREEEPDIGRHLFDVRIGRRNDDERRVVLGGRRDEQRLGGRREARDRPRGHTHPRTRGGGLQESAQAEGTRGRQVKNGRRPTFAPVFTGPRNPRRRRTRLRDDEAVRFVYPKGAISRAPIDRVHMTNCPACGSTDIHRSRSASLTERGLKLFSKERPHRCHACGWRGWGTASPHRHAVATTSDGWEAIDMDLSELDAAAAERRAQREEDAASSAEAATTGSRNRRHGRGHKASKTRNRTNSSEFNRRVQLVLFVALLLLGVVVVFRACSSNSRSTEPQEGQMGQVSGRGQIGLRSANSQPAPSAASALPASGAAPALPVLTRSTMSVVE